MQSIRFIRFLILTITSFALMNSVLADNYERNKAVAVEKVLFGHIVSVRNITETELIQDSEQGWKVFGGALVGGAIGHQFGGGHGQTAATILGAVIGGAIANDRNPEYQQVVIQLVELMITVESGQEYMVVQDYDVQMVFVSNDAVRMIYLENGTVRIDIQQ